MHLARMQKPAFSVESDLALLFQPMLMLGITISVALGVVFPYWLISVLIITLFLESWLLEGHLIMPSSNLMTGEMLWTPSAGVDNRNCNPVIEQRKSYHILRFNEELFFIYLLPPIIFNAGFQMKKKQFFHNFLTIMMFGVVGVFISFIIISAGNKNVSDGHLP